MAIGNFIDRIKQLQTIDKSMVDSLYRLSVGSITILLLLTIGTASYLYPVLSDKILIWTGLVILLGLLRLYCSYRYLHTFEKHSLEEWYYRFTVMAFLTAFLFSSLSFLFMPHIDAYYQLFIIAVLIGLTSGSMTSLSSDFRLAIGYISILLIPLIITLLWDENTPFSHILILVLILFYLAHIGMLIKIYRHELEFKELQSKQLFLHNLFQEAPIGIFTFDTEMKIIDFNQQLNKLFEDDPRILKGMDMHTLPDQRPVKTFSDSLSHGPQKYEGPYISINGKIFWIEAKAFPFSDAKQNILGGVGIIEDKTKEYHARQELKYLVEHDVLTGLLNRRGFRNFMKSLVEDAKHDTYYSLLFYLDLNQFKSINDSMGHNIGDEVLLSVSQRLKNRLPDTCTISRLGGDEFIIVVPHLTDTEEEIQKEAKHFSCRVEEIFHHPFSVEELLLHVKASIGIIMIEPKYRNIEEIIRHADITMYQAKKSNSHIAYYDESLDQKQKELFALQHDLADAIKNRQLRLFFQPIVLMKNEKILSAEMLLRWEHPTRGLLTPDTFISLASEAGLLSEITWWMLDSLCENIQRWKEGKRWNLEYISININAQQLTENDFAFRFLETLSKYHIETKDIMIEITERSLIDNFENTQTVINHLRLKGVRCAIDDFGIGYSSLSYLKKLSFNTLKIDREFVQNIETQPQELTLMKTILDIGREFKYHIVIEGIENIKQKEVLMRLDSTLCYQGYLFSKPLQADIFAQKYLKSESVLEG